MRVRARFVLVAVLLVAAVALGGEKPAVDPVEQDVTQGALRVVQDDGAVIECPLKHTDVQADISSARSSTPTCRPTSAASSPA